MMMLMIGATGELGFEVVRHAVAEGVGVRALVRPGTDAEDLLELGVEVFRGDLADPDSLAGVTAGTQVVIATANTIVPRAGEHTSSSALTEGYRALADDAELHGVERFVFVSVPTTLMGRGAAEFDEKAKVEEDLVSRSFHLCIVRPSLFMECWLPAIGSRLAVAQSGRATLNRGFWLSRFAGAVLQRTADRWRIAQIPGKPHVRHSFVCINDVAEATARAALSPELPAEVLVGGPEALTWREVVNLHEAQLGHKLLAVRIPSWPFRILSALLRLFSPTAAHLLAVQALVGQQPTAIDPVPAEDLTGRAFESVREFLRRSEAAGLASRGQTA